MYKNILLPIDLDNASSWEHALPAAVELCHSSSANLHALTVVPDFGMSIVSAYFPKDYKPEAMKGVMDHFRKFIEGHVPDDVNVRHIVGEGTVYDVILKMAEEVSADLIVMGSHRPEFKDYLLGPNASRVVRHATCSVLVVRG
ncbi:MAG: universal stress protein [Gammaproteobacteria bacterium]|nr:universal stress protein [Gammaproteobacteria bacterium]MDH3467891.1 universal stress protein [Gammaproteobacteria bacterium]